MKYIASTEKLFYTSVGVINIKQYDGTLHTFNIYRITDNELVILNLRGKDEMQFDSITDMLEHAKESTAVGGYELSYNLDINMQ